MTRWVIGPRSPVANPYAGDVARETVIAEAKILIKQLDTYLALIAEWALEEDDDAGQ